MAKVKMAAAFNRIYERVWVCMKCNAKIRADSGQVKSGKVKCRKCGYHGLRQKNKERKV
ncbi:MAG: 50S ribosomal protein L40e [Candidatus Aenigmarchaeota archaeon]|nr:50S ribosomal protein L40e [Candidatus Aenigmarchaeota archaeon]